MTDQEYESSPETVTVREVKAGNKILVTTLQSLDYAPKYALKKLYKDRWHVELDLRNIKTTMGMEIFSCKSPEMIEKEMWVYFLAYNLIRLVMAQSAMLADIIPRQISFKHSLQIWQAYRHQQVGLNDYENLKTLCRMVAEMTVGCRPGRTEPRAVKRRPKPFSLLMKPRGEARNIILKHGHPKKQK